MKRREFLRNLAAMPIVGRSLLSSGALLAGVKNAYAASGKTLVVIFQRGGCDGLNVVVPHGEDEYYRLRPDIAISRPGTGASAVLDLDGFFGLHPAMAPLHNIYQHGALAVMPTVHYDNANRSHFVSQDYIESGNAGKRLEDGWLNRHLSSSNQISNVRAVSFGNLTHALKGSIPVTMVQTLANFGAGLDNDNINKLAGIYQQSVSSLLKQRLLLKQHGELALENLSTLSHYKNQSYLPENGAIYPDTDYGKQLRDIAHLIKAGSGLEVATVNIEGWDTHSEQGGAQGAHASRLTEFSAGIAALYKDLGIAYMNDVVILTMTEFGRTAQQNGSKGTDHGNASSWFVIGNQVKGGVYGDWPGLASEQLYLGRYLAHSINFTDILSELLVKHLDNASGLTTALPGSQYRPIGFLS